jgi:hypothetical protein
MVLHSHSQLACQYLYLPYVEMHFVCGMFGPVDSLMWGGTGLYLGGQCPVGTSCLLSILLWTSLWLGAGMGAVGGGDIALGGVNWVLSCI